jgi:hypothetical protein
MDVLRRVGEGEDLSRPEDVGLRTSARALQSRGLVKVTRRDGGWQAVITVSGEFCLKHGRHPEHPGLDQDGTPVQPWTSFTQRADAAPASSGGPESQVTQRSSPQSPLTQNRHAAAIKLIKRLESEQHVTIEDPQEDVVTEWRRTIDFAKRHGLVPSGKWIEKRRNWAGDLTIELLTGDPPNRRVRAGADLPPVPVPSQLRPIHPVVARLRDDPARLVMAAGRRRRCLLILQALAAEAERLGHTVTDEPVAEHRMTRAYTYMGRQYPSRYSRREGEIRIGISEFSYTVSIAEESPQTADPEKSERLTIEMTRYRSEGRQCRWADRKILKVEDHLGAVLRELERRAVEDAAHILEERKAKVERRRLWELAIADARRQAYEHLDITALHDQVARWREAQEIGSYCQALAARLEDEPPDSPLLQRSREWLSWARERATALNPLLTLPTAPEHQELTPKDLRPYLKGWSPDGPEENPRW